MKMIFCLFFGPSSSGQHSNPETRLRSLLSLAEACHRFTPLISYREGEAIFLDMTASLHLFQQDNFARRVHALSRRFGFIPRIAAADDAPSALALARTGIRNLKDLPLESLVDFLSPFESIGSDPSLSKRARRMIDTLGTLGLSTLDDFLRVPTEMMASRFGVEGVYLAERVRKTRVEAWPGLKLPEIITERSDLFESDTMAPCSELEPLLFAARALIDRAMSRLRARSLRAAAIRLQFDIQKISGFKTVPNRKWEIYLPQPQGTAHGLLPILRDRLMWDLQREPLISPVASIELTILETAPGHGAQSCFFNRQLEDAEAWDSLVARLGHKLGSGKVFHVSPVDKHRPEAAWKADQPALPQADATAGKEAIPLRPARMLKKPELLVREGEELVRTSRRNQRWSIVRWEGPERINGEWWEGGFDRDYFRVHTSAGEQLWIYLAPPALTSDGNGAMRAGNPEFYLQGFFD